MTQLRRMDNGGMGEWAGHVTVNIFPPVKWSTHFDTSVVYTLRQISKCSHIDSNFAFRYRSSSQADLFLTQREKNLRIFWLGWPTLAWRRRRAKLIYFWKLVNNQGPPCLSSRIPKSVNNRCEYSLRNTGTVELPACCSSLYLSSFIPSSCLLWNSLPPDVSSSSSVSSFTLMLDSHFSSDRFTLGLS